MVFRATILCSVLLCTAPDSGTADDRLNFFEKQIRPVLVEHCYKCHSTDARNIRGGLLLDSRTGWEVGGDSGPAVVPGKPDESLLVSALKHESFEMPPEKRLAEGVIRDFERWIRDGAVDPRQGRAVERESIDLLAGREFWSFRPLQRPPVPTLSDWGHSEIDAFIEERFAAEQLSPSGDVSADQMVRRLFFTLIGLPPTPDDIRQFRTQWRKDADLAIASMTEQLLASPRYGERWGRHWLDVTRFAESSGGGRSLMFPEAWRFRDYVIRSFNDDKPFDQLIREHIAGDLLPAESDDEYNQQICGTAYLTLGPINYELQDKELLRMEVIDEQVDTMGRSFLGLTLGCARCHDHKFDPIPTREYYALAGIFLSTQSLVPGNVSGQVKVALRDRHYEEQLTAWKSRRDELSAQIKEIRRKTGLEIENRKGIDPDELRGVVIDDQNAELKGNWSKSTSVAPFVAGHYRYASPGTPEVSAAFRAILPDSGRYTVRVSFSPAENRASQARVIIHHADGVSETDLNQKKASPDLVFASVGTFPFTAERPAVVVIDASASSGGVVIADAVQFLKADSQTDGGIDEAERTRLEAQLPKLQETLDIHSRKKPSPPMTLSVMDQKEPADGHVHIRGAVRNRGERVPRGFLSVATPAVDESGLAAPAVIDGNASGRLELADWIASPRNPLTARVYVNRVWMHLIGAGLVRTPDNFGQTGVLPTHPEMLDYLAATFITDDDWSTKRLIRRIVNSRVFRLSAEPTSDSDPENLFLTRGFRRQLDAEALRDGVLQISGGLDLGVTSGRTITEVSKYDGNYDHASGNINIRSVYLPFLRNAIAESLNVFDTANPNVVSGRRTLTVLPGQALYLMNSPFIADQAKRTARHFLATRNAAPADQHDMIEEATLLTLGRSPTPEERELFSEVLDSTSSHEGAWTMIFHGLFGSIDFRFVD